MQFEKIIIPPGWKDSFTKYPNGRTIFEALSNTITSVNEGIEEVNKVLGDQENQTYRVKIVSLLNEYIDKRKGTPKELHINTCLRKAHFLSEIATETSLLEKKLTEGNTPPYYSENNINKGRY